MPKTDASSSALQEAYEDGMKPNIQTILYGPCKLPGHSDCTAILRHHEGRPTKAELDRYDVEMRIRPAVGAQSETTTYQLTAKGRTV